MILVVKELSKVETVKEWIDRAPADTKTFRKKHFLKYNELKIPPVINANGTLLVQARGPNQPPDILRSKMQAGEIHYFYNGRDVTRKNKETMDVWMARLFPKLAARKSAFHLEFALVPAAYAQSDFQNNRYLRNAENEGDPTLTPMPEANPLVISAIMASMTAKEWETAALAELNPGQDLTDYEIWNLASQENMVVAAKIMAKQYGLNCIKGSNHALFRFPYGGEPLFITAFFDHEKNMARTWFSRGQNPTYPRGEKLRLSFPAAGFEGGTEPMTINTAVKTSSGEKYDEFQGGLSNPAFLEVARAALDDGKGVFANDPTGLEEAMKGVTVLSDWARGCCAKEACRNATTGAALQSVEPMPLDGAQ